LLFSFTSVLETSFPRNGAGLQSGPSSHRAAGLWLATALPLTAERAVSASGFTRGNDGFKRGENKEGR
jgi:hypothetical protein